jgi:hypothetical protein
MGEHTRAVQDWAIGFLRSGRQWVDLYASADPVPNGPLFIKDGGGIESIEIHNGASVISDHTGYQRNSEQFYATVVHAIAFHSSIKLSSVDQELNDAKALNKAAILRRYRVIGERFDHLLLALAFVLALINTDLLIGLGTCFLDLVNSTCSLFSSDVELCWTWPAQLVGALVVFTIFLLLRLVLQSLSWLCRVFAEDALFRRAAGPEELMASAPGHVVSALALALVIQTYTTHLFGWVEAFVRWRDYTGNAHHLQASVVGMFAGFLIATLHMKFVSAAQRIFPVAIPAKQAPD